MSWVMNIVLSFSVCEDTEERMAEVNRFFESVPNNYKGGVYEEEPLASVEEVWEGKGRDMECNLFIGAYNFFPLEAFMAHLKTVNWEEPDNVQLFVQDQEDLKFHLIDVFPPEPSGEPNAQ
jgi:hypothetical protein